MNLKPLFLLAAALALLVALACQQQREEVPLTSGIQGQVLLGPTCPLEREDRPCPDRPFPATVDVWDADRAQRITTFTTDADGRFRVPLPPGEYYLDPRPPAAGTLPSPIPQTVTVAEDAYTTVTLRYDSGIR